jgi:hypothetical protein
MNLMGLRNLPVLAAMCLLISVPQGAAQEVEPMGAKKPDKPINRIIHLSPPAGAALEPDATGIAKISLKTKGNARQRFQVVGANLKGGTSYHLFVNGIDLATETADVEPGEGTEEEAAVEFIFVKKAKGKLGEGETSLPASLDPVTKITTVMLKDSAGNVVLAGAFPQ